MAISVFELFKIGIGPSSSHTVGPMRAAKLFANQLLKADVDDQIERVKIELYGSLGATGKGHGSDRAIILGLEGESPEDVVVDQIESRLAGIIDRQSLHLDSGVNVSFDPAHDLIFHRRKTLPYHSNGMIFQAFDKHNLCLLNRRYYSVGGGFVVDEEAAGADRIVKDETPLAFPFASASELLAQCAEQGMSISELMLSNEQAWRSKEEARVGLLRRWEVMQA